MNLKNLFGDAMSSAYGVSERTEGPNLQEAVIKDNESKNKIVVINVDGVISGQAVDGTGYSLVSIIKEQLRRAKKDASVKAVLLKVDSPGGEVLASDDIAKAIRKFKNDSGKPVVVSMGSLAASGGYYVSAPCSWIVANELTITGSIGVIMHGMNYRGLLDKVGVRPEVYKSGKFKDMLSGTKSPAETLPEEREMVQSMIDETFQKFKSVVKEGRQTAYNYNKAHGHEGQPLDSKWEDFADGRILSGNEAYRLGFVDEVGDFEKAVDRTHDLAKIRSANLVMYQPIFELSSLFRMFGKSDAKAVKIDLGIEIPKLRPGCQYFLAPNYLY